MSKTLLLIFVLLCTSTSFASKPKHNNDIAQPVSKVALATGPTKNFQAFVPSQTKPTDDSDTSKATAEAKKEAIGLSPMIYWSGIAVSLSTLVGSGVSYFVAQQAAEERNALAESSNGTPINGNEITRIEERSTNANHTALALLLTSAVTAGITLFIIEPLTFWNGESE